MEEYKINKKIRNENEAVRVEREESVFEKKYYDLVIGIKRNQTCKKEKILINYKDE